VNHQKLVNETARELQKKDSVLALILYGSVSRHEEKPNSDIDLLVITTENHCQKRHTVRNGVTIEFLEMHLNYLRNFIAEKEIPVLFTLTEGIILFDKDSVLAPFIKEAALIIENGPPVNEKWDNVRYATKKRSDFTEIYEDLLDTDNIIVFHYLISLLISSAIPMLTENYNLWPKTRKKTINYLENQCVEGYRYIEIMLSPKRSLSEKRDAAKGLINFALKRHGGILEGDAVIFNF
jgi:predicted nucleotidyltransferase